MPKRNLRESVLSMVNEFVGMNKTPDFRLSQESNKFIDAAVKNECAKARSDNVHHLQIMFDEIDDELIAHVRTNSSTSGYRKPKRQTTDFLERRQSLPVEQQKHSSLFKFTRKPQQVRDNSISESNESMSTISTYSSTDGEPSRCRITIRD
ncbi:hypothetical protein M3Y98_00163700 [Aphelenchoides besseyi]|nr:hypothetical protein M3Y98_00163700 [Aphelenchoides besseyi]KAI6199935.1 hypothetical protein M3Y96_00680000 [Aphelenchoides besseyi]